LVVTTKGHTMDKISIEDKVKIASGFLLSSPPGEVNDVFNGK
jgi:capping protein alpha